MHGRLHWLRLQILFGGFNPSRQPCKPAIGDELGLAPSYNSCPEQPKRRQALPEEHVVSWGGMGDLLLSAKTFLIHAKAIVD
jgi:hypothetical protein